MAALGWSRGDLGMVLGGLGAVLGLNVSLLGRSWNLLGRLWVGLGTVWVLNVELNVPDCAMLRTMLRALGPVLDRLGEVLGWSRCLFRLSFVYVLHRLALYFLKRFCFAALLLIVLV